MNGDDRIARLRRMLRQVAPEPARVASIIDERPRDSNESPGEAATARIATEALGKIEQGRERDLTPQESFTLEAIIMPERRPVAFIRKGTYENIIAPWTHLNTETVRARLVPLIRSIGRIELPNTPEIPYGGTGFVVGRDMMMTNRHVARLFATGLGTTITYRPGDASIDFKRESGSASAAATLRVIQVVMIHPYWDMAVLKVEGLNGRFAPLPLAVQPPDELVDEDVVVIGYPARDGRNDLTVQDHVFQKQYEVKRIQPGKLRPRARISSFENEVNAFTHDSSTLGGNSGSAVIHVATGRVVGLHFAGLYLKANYGVPMYELARDTRVSRLGLNFDGSVPPTTQFDAAWRSAAGGEGVAVMARDGSGASWTIPLRVDVTIGMPIATGSGGPAPTVAIEAMKVPIIHPGLEQREGFDGSFLELSGGATVPLPGLSSSGKQVASALADGSNEIKYHKFSIVMHRARRLALLTAANVDWRPSARLINGKKPTRKQLTGLSDNDREKWAVDDRLDEDEQLPDAFYTKDGGAFDKGHLVRRDDVAWGKTFADMQKANGDTYHTTNCSPQVMEFNQASKGDENWGELETLVQQQTKTERAVLFSGPVFEEDDPLFEGVDGAGGTIRLRIPRSFWKIVVVKQGNGAGAYGFILEQDLSDVPAVEEFIVPDMWKRHMRPIADIEERLGGLLDLSWLKQRDRFDSAEGRAIGGQVG